MKKLFYIVFALFPVFPVCVSAQLKINEIMTNNVSSILDEDYNYSMWVELYNEGTTTINQNLYYFSDDLKKPTKWKPAVKYISAKSYSVLWFEREDFEGHANFKLDPEGGKLYLLNSSLQVVDSILYPRQYRNASYGRVTDGSESWVYFQEPSPNAKNDNNNWTFERCSKPVFLLDAGFYSSSKNVKFENPLPGDTIYYTLNGTEPTKQNGTRYTPGFVVTLTSTTCVRARSVSANKLSSDITSSTFFIGERNFTLPVVSIITDPKNLTDNTIGIYVKGTNGIVGNGSDVPVNWNQNWDRPVNFELIDTSNVCRLSQELDISISGGWSRLNGQKSLKISPKKKFGNNQLNYDFFPQTKPWQKYRDIQIRNSGNDFFYTMFRDGYMNELVRNRMDLDYNAYEPAVCFMNGVYYGIQNLRERSNTDYLYSNYGLEEGDVYLLESEDLELDSTIISLNNLIAKGDITKPEIYNQVGEMMDIDNFINYQIAEIYYGNTDWPHNNVKVWKRKYNGKWRWILYDTDFGYSLYDTNLFNHNSLLYALGEKTGQIPAGWSTLFLRRLILNDTFRQKFIDRFCVQIAGTFNIDRANTILDGMANKVRSEIVYHKSKWGSYRSFDNDISNMKNFTSQRPDKMLGFISNRFYSGASLETIQLSSNIETAKYMFNNETVSDANITLKYFGNQNVTIEPAPVKNYIFKHWEIGSQTNNTLQIVSKGSLWSYYDGSSLPASNWNSIYYNSLSWKTGYAQLGYGSKGETTTIDFGGVSSNKNPTAYFRKTVSINNITSKSNFSISVLADDGAIVYFNGVEIGRQNMPAGTISYSTYASSSNNGITSTYSVPENLLNEGINVIAVEVHQVNATSSDLMFDLDFSCSDNSGDQIITTPVYSSVLSGALNLKAIYEESTLENDVKPTIVINEILSSNFTVNDEFGEADDYIELYNYGETEVNIAGWYLSDLKSNKKMAQIPSKNLSKTLIPAKGRLVIWADNDPEQGELHVGFRVGSDGETIYLSRMDKYYDLQIVDSVNCPSLGWDLSYSRVPDGSDNWLVQQPTCNASNGDISELILPKTECKVYPTFVNDHFNVMSSVGETITITDLTGKVILKKACQSDIEQIQASHFIKGMYLVKVGNRTFKIVKL